jgi:hypothetical protein
MLRRTAHALRATCDDVTDPPQAKAAERQVFEAAARFHELIERAGVEESHDSLDRVVPTFQALKAAGRGAVASGAREPVVVGLVESAREAGGRFVVDQLVRLADQTGMSGDDLKRAAAELWSNDESGR